MNTRRTIQNWDEVVMGDSDDEKDREPDDHDRQRERDDEHYRERSGDRGREPLSRQVTGAESQRHPSELMRKRATGEGHDVPLGATPPKRALPVLLRYHTDLGGDAQPKKPATRYRGTEPLDPRRGGHTSTSERQV